MRKRILIIHPEGNLNNNPNLTGIVEILAEAGYLVDVKSPKMAISQSPPCEGVRFLLENEYFVPKRRRLIDRFGSYLLSGIAAVLVDPRIIVGRYKLVIGVDRYGIVEASSIGRLLGIPCGMISYELFFSEETGPQFKEVERKASRQIQFAICQDKLRASHLSSENDIPIDRIVCVPGAGRAAKPGEKTYLLHDRLGIDRGKKIALVSGSIDEWAMIKELTEAVRFWPEEWVLVLHDRYSSETAEHFKAGCGSDRVFVSKIQIPDIRMIGLILHAADLGIALYRPDYKSYYTGNNLKHIGLSSGKISSYLQHGLPVLTNELGEISELVRRNRLGFVVRDVNDIRHVLTDYDRERYSGRCLDFFSKNLDLNLLAERILSTIDQSITRV